MFLDANMKSKMNVSDATSVKKKFRRESIGIIQKIEILDNLKRGARVVDMARAHGLHEASIRTIKKREDKIRNCLVNNPRCALLKRMTHRSEQLNKTEKLLIDWIEQETKTGTQLTFITIREKALELYKTVCEEAGRPKKDCLFSSGWFHNFKLRNRLHGIKYGDASANRAPSEMISEHVYKLAQPSRSTFIDTHQRPGFKGDDGHDDSKSSGHDYYMDVDFIEVKDEPINEEDWADRKDGFHGVSVEGNNRDDTQDDPMNLSWVMPSHTQRNSSDVALLLKTTSCPTQLQISTTSNSPQEPCQLSGTSNPLQEPCQLSITSNPLQEPCQLSTTSNPLQESSLPLSTARHETQEPPPLSITMNPPEGATLKQAGTPIKKNKLETEMQVLEQLEQVDRGLGNAKSTNLAESPLCSRKENHKKVKRSRNVIETMESLLHIWIEDGIKQRIPLSMTIIQEKARNIIEDIKGKEGESVFTKSFNASCSWFERFMRRTNLHKLKLTEEGIGADTEAANQYSEAFKNIIEEGEYLPCQVFSVSDTTLYWTKMPDRTFVSCKEKKATKLDTGEDQLTLLVGTNAAGEFPLKPLLIYHREDPEAVQDYCKSYLPVLWRSNKKAWMTRHIFKDWFMSYFCPAVENYCKRKNIDHKALLIIDSLIIDRVPGHPTFLSDASPHIRVEFLPKNTTTVLQPMDQGVISMFKCFYMQENYSQMIRSIDTQDLLQIQVYWQNYNILDAIKSIEASWNKVKESTLNAAWRNLWPECVCDFLGFNKEESEAWGIVSTDLEDEIKEVVRLAHTAGFIETEACDVQQVLQLPREPLTTDDLLEVEKMRTVSCEDDDEETDQPINREMATKKMFRALRLLDTALAAIQDMDPIVERSSSICKSINHQVECYRRMYSEKRKAALEAKLDALLINSFPETPSTITKSCAVTLRDDEESDEW